MITVLVKKPFSARIEQLVSNFRGLPESTHWFRDKGTKAFSSALETCIEQYHIGRSTPEELILENWERIVGQTFAKRCRPERIDGNTLLIQVPNATLRRELMFMESRILTALGSLDGCQHVNRIALKSGS